MDAASELQEQGFVVIPGPELSDRMELLVDAYTAAVASATGDDVSSEPRRSLQGAFIPREGHAGTDFSARMPPETRARLGPLARYVLAL